VTAVAALLLIAAAPRRTARPATLALRGSTRTTSAAAVTAGDSAPPSTTAALIGTVLRRAVETLLPRLGPMFRSRLLPRFGPLLLPRFRTGFRTRFRPRLGTRFRPRLRSGLAPGGRGRASRFPGRRLCRPRSGPRGLAPSLRLGFGFAFCDVRLLGHANGPHPWTVRRLDRGLTVGVRARSAPGRSNTIQGGLRERIPRSKRLCRPPRSRNDRALPRTGTHAQTSAWMFPGGDTQSSDNPPDRPVPLLLNTPFQGRGLRAPLLRV
jgi:hypothetical protein